MKVSYDQSFEIQRRARPARAIEWVCAAVFLAFCCGAGALGQAADSPQQATPAPAVPAPAAKTPSDPAAADKTAVAGTPLVSAAEAPKDPAVKLTPAEEKDQQRKDQLAADTAKLLQLANELKAEMDKSTKDTLSLNVVKKAEQVEKLAHKVRDEMKATAGN